MEGFEIDYGNCFGSQMHLLYILLFLLELDKVFKPIQLISFAWLVINYWL